MPSRIGVLGFLALIAECACHTTILEDSSGKKFKLQYEASPRQQPHISFKHSEIVELELPAGDYFNKEQKEDGWNSNVFYLSTVVTEKEPNQDTSDLKGNHVWAHPVARKSGIKPEVESNHIGRKWQHVAKIVKQTEDDDDSGVEDDDSEDQCSDCPVCATECEKCAAEATMTCTTVEHTTPHLRTTRNPANNKKDDNYKKEMWKCEPISNKNETTKMPVLWMPLVIWSGPEPKIVWVPIAGGGLTFPETSNDSLSHKKFKDKQCERSQQCLNCPPTSNMADRPVLPWMQNIASILSAGKEGMKDVDMRYPVKEVDPILEKPPMWSPAPYWQSAPWQGMPYSWAGSMPWHNSRWFPPSGIHNSNPDSRRCPQNVQDWCKNHQNDWQVSVQGKDEPPYIPNDAKPYILMKDQMKVEVPMKDDAPEQEFKITNDSENDENGPVKPRIASKKSKASVHRRKGPKYKSPEVISVPRASQFVKLQKKDGRRQFNHEHDQNHEKCTQIQTANQNEQDHRNEKGKKKSTLNQETPSSMVQTSAIVPDKKLNETKFYQAMLKSQEKNLMNIPISLQQGSDERFTLADNKNEDLAENKNPIMHYYNIDQLRQRVNKIEPNKDIGQLRSADQSSWWEAPLREEQLLPKLTESRSPYTDQMTKDFLESGKIDAESKLPFLKFDNNFLSKYTNPTQWRDVQVINRSNDLLEDGGEKLLLADDHTDMNAIVKVVNHDWQKPPQYAPINPDMSTFKPGDVESKWWDSFTEGVESIAHPPSGEESKQLEKARFNLNPSLILGPPPYIGNLPILNYDSLSSENIFKNPEQKSQIQEVLFKGETTNSYEEQIGPATTKDDNVVEDNPNSSHEEKLVAALLRPQWEDSKIQKLTQSLKQGKKESDRFDLFSSELRSTNSESPVKLHNQNKFEVESRATGKTNSSNSRQPWLNNKFSEVSDKIEVKSAARKGKVAPLHECQDMLGMASEQKSQTTIENSTAMSKRSRGKKWLTNPFKFQVPDEPISPEDVEKRYGKMINNLVNSETEFINPTQLL